MSQTPNLKNPIKPKKKTNKNPIKPKKKKKPKKPTGLVFLKKNPGFFQPWLPMGF
jgi:hypothetical protein